MTKRTLAMLLALLALLLTGCGNAEPKTTEAESAARARMTQLPCPIRLSRNRSQMHP